MSPEQHPSERGILVVDDDDDVREALRRLLDDEGYAVAVASNGVEALDYLRSSAPRPSVILLDLMMPVMNGWQFRGVQKKDPDLCSIPVVVLSASGAARERVGLLGVSEVILKPFDLEDLLRSLEVAQTPPRTSQPPSI
jgi:CheY-like chemotaxis protein